MIEGNHSGYQQSKFCEDRPLQINLYCDLCGSKFTGYKAKKKFDYYKCQNKECKCKDLNANTTSKSKAKGVNDLFIECLSSFELSHTLVNAFKAQMNLTIKQLDKDSQEDSILLKKRLNESETNLTQLERKYVFDNCLDSDVYSKFKAEILEEKSKIIEKLSSVQNKISNQDDKINKCVEVAQNLSNMWSFGNIQSKFKIQKLVFPNGIVLNPIKRELTSLNYTTA